MTSGPRIVLDANILIRAVLGTRVKRIITDLAEHAEFLAPEVAYSDAEHYLPSLLVKHGRSEEIDEALAYIQQLRGGRAAGARRGLRTSKGRCPVPHRVSRP